MSCGFMLWRLTHIAQSLKVIRHSTGFGAVRALQSQPAVDMIGVIDNDIAVAKTALPQRKTQGSLHMTDQRIKSFPVSWEELHRTSKALAWRLLELGPFEGLVAVTRGGLVPAAIVARELEVRLIDTACISSYHGSAQGALNVLKPSEMAGDGAGWLIVDDLVDTGETAKALRAMMPKAHFATVYAKPAGRPLVDTFVTEVSQDTWIFFPWDLEPQPSTPIIGQAG